MSAHRLGATAAVRVVVERELRERTRTRGFRLGTVVMLVFVAGLAVLPRVLPDPGDPEWTVGAVGTVPAGLDDAVARVAGDTATVELRAVEGDPEQLATDDEIDAVLVDARELVVEGSLSDQLHGILNAAVGQMRATGALADLGLSEVQAAELLAPEPLGVRMLTDDDRMAREAVAFAGSIILMIAILTYGGWVQYSVLEEKANRIVELIVSAVRPAHLLAGKVIAVGLIGVGQLVLLVAAGMTVAALAGTLPDLPAFVPGVVAWVLVWFVLGFAFYAVGYAAAGALTSRHEEAQSAAMPLLTVVMTAYFVSVFFVAPNPGTTTAQILSLVPLLAPIAMPARIAGGEAAFWEVALAIGLMVVAIVAMVALAGKIYERALLHTGGRVRLADALRRSHA